MSDTTSMTSDTASVVSDMASSVSSDSSIPTHRQLTYMAELNDKLIEKRGVCDSTAKQTIACLTRVNGGKGFTNLTVLTDVAAVQKYVMEGRSEKSQSTLYGHIVSALDTMESDRYKKPLEMYRSLMKGAVDVVITEKKERGAGLTDKEAAVWMSWPDILAHYEKVEKEVDTILKKSGEITALDYAKVMDHMVLSLYTQMAPRRNKDYSCMFVTRKAPGDDKTKNYYVMDEGKMYFNAYKTLKTHGQQIVDVPKKVQAVIERFLKLTGSYRRSRGRAPLMPLICSYDGAHMEAANAMTKLLNRAFGKKVSCNIIRHSYVSGLYSPAVVGMVQSSKDMGHSLKMHLDYYRDSAAAVGGAGTDIGAVIDLD